MNRPVELFGYNRNGIFSPGCVLIDGTILLDAGGASDIPENRLSGVRDILLSHSHHDHVGDLPYLAFRAYTEKRSVRVHGSPKTLLCVRKHVFNRSIWPNLTVMPSIEHPAVRMKTVKPGKIFPLSNGWKATAFSMRHSIPAFGYLLRSPEKTLIFYTGDTGPLPEKFWQKTCPGGVDTLISECTLQDSMAENAVEWGHLTPSLLAAEVARMPMTPKNIVLVHVSPVFRGEIERRASVVLRGKSCETKNSELPQPITA